MWCDAMRRLPTLGQTGTQFNERYHRLVKEKIFDGREVKQLRLDTVWQMLMDLVNPVMLQDMLRKMAGKNLMCLRVGRPDAYSCLQLTTTLLVHVRSATQPAPRGGDIAGFTCCRTDT
jgi:hypothetical protein